MTNTLADFFGCLFFFCVGGMGTILARYFIFKTIPTSELKWYALTVVVLGVIIMLIRAGLIALFS